VEIFTNKKTKKVTDIEERLISNTLAYKLIIDKKYKKLFLKDGSTKIEGFEAINKYIDQFESEKQQWYYCDC